MSSIQNIIYLNPIEEDIPRSLFQDWTRSRLRIYAFIDQNKQTMFDNALQKIKNTFVGSEGDKNLLTQIYNPWSINNQKNKIKDNVTHYICRLMFCLSPEKKDLFVANETIIFKNRLAYKSKVNFNEKILFELLSNISENQNMKWGDITEVSAQQFVMFKQQIYSSSKNHQKIGSRYELFKPNRLYKVPIECCEYLLSKRSCFVHEGFAYLQKQLLLKVVPRMYSKYLRLALDRLQNQAYQILANDKDNQFREFIRHESSNLFNKNVNPQALRQKLNLKNISIISRRSFPPCMIQMYDTLVTKKHLKHQARLQLTLFLKVAGLSLQDNQQLWKLNYTKGVNQSQQKQILYNVRHSYGQQGKRTDYNSKDCQKIINSKPTSGQVHGCPFKYFGNQQLTKFLKSKYPKVDSQAISQIIVKKQKKQFQLACRKVFQKTHISKSNKGSELSKGVGRQPNMYYYNSQKFYEHFFNKM